MTFEERLIEEAKDAIAAEIHDAVPSKQLTDYPTKQWERLGSFGPVGTTVLYHWTDEVSETELYAIARKGVTLAWLTPESAQELAELIQEDAAKNSGEKGENSG